MSWCDALLAKPDTFFQKKSPHCRMPISTLAYRRVSFLASDYRFLLVTAVRQLRKEIQLPRVPLPVPLHRQPSHGRKVGVAQKFRRLTVILMRGQSQLQAPLACKGSAFGVDLLSKETAESVMQARISGTDLVLGVPIAFGLGFGLNSAVMPLSPNQNTCFWGGWGGSSVVVDQDASLSASFVMNKMFCLWAIPGPLVLCRPCIRVYVAQSDNACKQRRK